MTITHCIDWLQYSTPYRQGDNPIKIIAKERPQHSITELTGEKGTNIKAYNTCLLMGAGKAHFHTEHPENKISLQWTGNDLKETAKAGLSAEVMIEAGLQRQNKFTRLDFAIDIKKQGARQLDILEGLNDGTVKTKAQNWGAYLGFTKEDGKTYADGTVYIGSAKGQRMVRIYDKGAEQLTREDWTRIELVSRKDAAQQLALGMATSSIGNAGRAALRGFVETSITWFASAVYGEAVYFQPIETKDANTMRWLLETVLPILQREMEGEAVRDEDMIYNAVTGIVNRVGDLRARRAYTPEG